MSTRKYNFDEGEEPRVDPEIKLAEKARALQKAGAKLIEDEKRWLRRKRLANTKLKKITAAKRRLRKRINQLRKES